MEFLDGIQGALVSSVAPAGECPAREPVQGRFRFYSKAAHCCVGRRVHVRLLSKGCDLSFPQVPAQRVGPIGFDLPPWLTWS